MDAELRVPADGAFVAVVRTTATGLAARLDFTIDELEDLRMAVGEACALVLPEAVPGAALDCHFALAPGRFTMTVSVAATAPELDRDGFAWQVLDALADDVVTEITDDRFSVSLTLRASLADTPVDH
ncbi:hypothetical protein [Nocardioides limicola]|uniref:hypothetical protein n=1 Tax=Nocardioides limicola TaxID=2803368 RepID=UPI00193AFE55|nr:hypothetical protein [Nocardioides sp. DJM-14]